MASSLADQYSIELCTITFLSNQPQIQLGAAVQSDFNENLISVSEPESSSSVSSTENYENQTQLSQSENEPRVCGVA